MISVVLPNLKGGGAERIAVNLVNFFVALGIKAEFVLLNKEGQLLQLVSSSVSIYDLRADRIRDSILPLARYFRIRNPEVILVSMWPLTSAAIVAWRIARARSSLFVQDHNNLSITCANEVNVSLRTLSSSIRLTYPLATGRMAVSEGVKSDLCRISGLSPDQFKVIYNPVVSENFCISPKASSLPSPWPYVSQYRIIAVGTLKVQKNFPLLLEAFSILRRSINAHLSVLGDGDQRPILENLVNYFDLAGDVSFPGFVLDPSPWMQHADLFVLSSSWEGLPTVIIEALGFGIPVVSTNCPSGPEEILEQGRYGRLVPVGDAEALALAMKSSLLELHDHDALRRRAQDFAVPTIAGQYLTYFRSMGAKV